MTRHRPLPVPLEELPFVLRLDERTPPLDWAALFGRRAPVEIEIGSGKGLFLAGAARRRPEVDFVGVECAGKWFRRAAHRFLHEPAANVRIVQTDAFAFLGRWVPERSVRVLHVYFPDPWPKKRHARRRLLQNELYELAARSLMEGGEFRFASDVQGYFEEALATLSAHPGFGRVLWPDDATEELSTSYAVKYRREGRALHLARFIAGAAAPGAAGAGAIGETVDGIARAPHEAARTGPRVLGSPAGGER